MRDAKENREKKWPREILGLVAFFGPRILRVKFFFLAVFFHVTHDGPSERATTRSPCVTIIHKIIQWPFYSKTWDKSNVQCTQDHFTAFANLTKKVLSTMDLSEHSWTHEWRLKLFLVNNNFEFFYLVNKVEGDTSVKTNTKRELLKSRTKQQIYFIVKSTFRCWLCKNQ